MHLCDLVIVWNVCIKCMKCYWRERFSSSSIINHLTTCQISPVVLLYVVCLTSIHPKNDLNMFFTYVKDLVDSFTDDRFQRKLIVLDKQGFSLWKLNSRTSQVSLRNPKGLQIHWTATIKGQTTCGFKRPSVRVTQRTPLPSPCPKPPTQTHTNSNSQLCEERW